MSGIIPTACAGDKPRRVKVLFPADDAQFLLAAAVTVGTDLGLAVGATTA